MDEILTTRQAAEFLQFSEKTIRYFVATGQIPFSRVGKRYVRFRRSRLEKWLQEREDIEYRLPRKEKIGLSGSTPRRITRSYLHATISGLKITTVN